MPAPTTDFSIFDGQELVSYDSASDPVVDNVRALRRPLTRTSQRNVERYVDLEPTDVVFHLDAAPLATTELAAGDSLTDSNSQVHLVLFVERQALNNSVSVVCRPQSA